MDYKFKPCTYEETSCRVNPCAGSYKSVQVFELVAGKFKRVTIVLTIAVLQC